MRTKTALLVSYKFKKEETMIEKEVEVLQTDNGIISIALQIYASFVQKELGDQRLCDRAIELSYIFRDMGDK